jgi:UDP-N-acetylmuramoylalanine--D-glutamate ligase
MMVAIDTFNDNIIMIIGGLDKGKTDFYQALKKYSDKIIFIVCYGQSGESIFNQLKNHIKSSYSKDFSEAVSNAISQCKGDDVLLFSPGCASYDQFNSYVERGDKFKEIIYGLS